MKRVLVLTVVALGAFALAEVIAAGAKGAGTVKADDGRIGYFGFRTVKTTSGSAVKFEGSLGFVQSNSATSSPQAAIYMPLPTRLDATANVCVFSGPGVLLRKNASGQEEELRGQVQCRVADNRKPTTVGTPDRFLVRFIRNGVQVYGFSGSVVRGDLEVFTRIIQ